MDYEYGKPITKGMLQQLKKEADMEGGGAVAMTGTLLEALVDEILNWRGQHEARKESTKPQ